MFLGKLIGQRHSTRMKGTLQELYSLPGRTSKH